mgnify:CR=1 FL=1
MLAWGQLITTTWLAVFFLQWWYVLTKPKNEPRSLQGFSHYFRHLTRVTSACEIHHSRSDCCLCHCPCPVSILLGQRQRTSRFLVSDDPRGAHFSDNGMRLDLRIPLTIRP